MKNKILDFIIVLCLLSIFILIFGKPAIENLSAKLKDHETNENGYIAKNFHKVAVKVKNGRNGKIYINKINNQISHDNNYKREYNSDKYSQTKNKYQYLAEQNEDFIIPVNLPTELSYKSKQYIYEERKKYVAKSLFADENYAPSEEVFGQIEDNKPWVSVNFCDNEFGTSIITGASEESRFINNPTMLVALEFPYRYPKEYMKACSDPVRQLVPERIIYSPEKKEIIVTYTKLYPQHDHYYTFNGINARDLGYKYAYVDKTKTTLRMRMREEYNITNHVTEFQNFIHLGYSCKVEGGCNNGSPEQPMLDFIYRGSGTPTHKQKIYIKLWKNKPSSPLDTPDMVEIINFRI